MKTPARLLRLVAASSLMILVAGCGGSGNNTSVNLSGTITGLNAAGLVLSNGISIAAVAAGANTFVFPSRVLIGSNYAVVVSALPATLICTVANGVGYAKDASDITNVTVTCVPRNLLGGTVTGLTGAGLVLTNGSDQVPALTGDASGNAIFTFPTPVADGATYGAAILTQPAGQTCTVANGTAVMGAAPVTNVTVSCR
jgi:hypothetical protein